MREYNFNIVVGGKKITTDDSLGDIADALYEAGCGDGDPEVCNGTLYVNFTRHSESYAKAVQSAIANIESVAGLRCLSVDMSEIISLSDAAERTGLTTSALSRYYKGSRGAGNFPTPIFRVDSNRPLWAWTDIAEWLAQHDLIDDELVEQARITDAINTALSIRNNNSMDTVFQCLYALKFNHNRTAIAL
ncbi:DNA-binding protein (plasmid) [Xenorhabdus stockiae]|uniref:DNA-binding protein n=1 Tax=Xenorhabdus stockiae TaxID=351614 RepID=UPI003CE6800C